METINMQPPKKVEYAVIARCKHCKQELYSETFVDKVVNGKQIEVAHNVTGQQDTRNLRCVNPNCVINLKTKG